jgi:hypothetical protein
MSKEKKNEEVSKDTVLIIGEGGCQNNLAEFTTGKFWLGDGQ